MPNTDAALVLVLVVVAVAANGFRAAGYLAAVSAAVWFDFFLTQPYQRFTIDRVADVRTTVLLLLVGVAVTEIAVWGRRKAALASGQEAYLAGIREATADRRDRWLRHPPGRRRRVAARADPRASRGCASSTAPPASASRRGCAATARSSGGTRSGTSTAAACPPASTSSCWWSPRGRLTGRYLMRANPDSRPTRSERLVAMTLAGQVGAAGAADARPASGSRQDRAPATSGDRQGRLARRAARRFDTGMADVAFVLLTIAVFAVLALVVKGVEKL